MRYTPISTSKIVRGFSLAGFIVIHAAMAQTVVPVGSGSYASSTPSSEAMTDSYYALPQNQVTQFYGMLHLDPSLAGKPIPTNHWWSDLLIGNRSYLPNGANQYVIQQDAYGGNMWFIPGMLAPKSYGFDVFYPNSWRPANGSGTQGSIDAGNKLTIKGAIPYGFPPEDILLADFEGSYPIGSVITGNAFGTPPSSDTGQTGFIGTRMASSRGSNANQGKIVLPNFTANKHYLHLLVGGGNTVDTSVRLVINGAAVLTATGVNSTSLRWVTWDLAPYTGQTAHVEIVDSTGIAFGFISCDQIFLSDASNPAGRFGGDLAAAKTIVTNWGDWNVDFNLADTNGRKVDVTMVRGVPFTWTRWTNVKPRLMLGAATTFYNSGGAPITVTGGSFTAAMFAMTVGGKTYGVFLPDNTVCTVGGSGSSSYVEPQVSGANNYMVIGYLPAISRLAEFGLYAYARPTDTQISWALDPQNGCVTTTWNLTTVAMKGSNLSTIQGWLPHHYRTTTANFAYQPYTYQTQRGIMKAGVGNSFQIKFPFQGITPVLPPPVATGYTNNFQPARMTSFLTNFKPGNMLGDTYGAGKALTLCGQYLTLADEMGDTANFDRIKSALTTALQNWLTYTPGEGNGYFSRYNDWKAFIGWDASYGSQAFNDLHFHYGYFAHAAALLGKYDKTFLANYGPMLRLVVKTFANYDRNDHSEPFMRTFDIWEGHGNAGGLSSANGVNQESSSEAMNAWVGVYLLGSMMNDSQMTAAGAMGFAMESCAVNEYWQDLYKTNFPPGFTRAGAGKVWSDNFDYYTYFSADPAWTYAIQYLPSAHWMNYMVRDQTATVAQKYQAMWSERAAWNGETSTNPSILGGYPGCYVLAYQALWDHVNTPVLFDNSYTANEDIARNNTYSGATYYLIHAMRQTGDQDFSYSSNIPTSGVYYNATSGVRTAVLYNPSPSGVTATLYKNGAAAQSIFVAGYSDIVVPLGTTPVITSVAAASGSVGAAFSYQIVATNNPTGYSVTGTLPDGVSLNLSTGLISGTPTATGTSNVTISASNAGATGSKALSITISAPIPAPSITSPTTALATVGAAFSYQIAATSNPTMFNAAPLPDGLTVDNSTGVISGTPTVAGSTNVTLTASNTTGPGAATLALTVNNADSDTNLALGQSVTALSAEAANPAANANDASGATRWAAGTAAFPQWWRVDLGAARVLSRADIKWYSSATRSYKYKIEVSADDANYTTVVDKIANTTMGDTSDLFAAEARYVRVTVTGSSAGFASALDIAIFGHTATPPAAATLDSAVSRQSHGGLGNFDVAVPLSGSPLVEARKDATSGSYKIVLNFSAPVSGINATLGLQAGQSGVVAGMVASVTYDASGTVVTVTLTGVGNAQRLKLQLSGGATADIPINVLCGDVNGDGTVNVLDLGQIRMHSGETVGALNCRFDENSDGAINILDMGATRLSSGTSLP